METERRYTPGSVTIRTDVGTDALLWEQADWLDEAVGWIEAELERLGLHATGQVEQSHVRPWSTVLRIPTADAYLEPWTAFRPHHDLVPAVPAADLLGAVGRALNWQLVADATPPADRGEYDQAVADRLRLLAERL
jgi:hypothetical protein